MILERINRFGLFIAVLGATTFATIPAQADTLIFNLDTVFSGSITPIGSTPWLSAKVSSTPDPNVLSLAFDVSNLTANGQYVDSIYMNFQNPNGTAADLNFLRADINPATSAVQQSATQTFKADGDGFFNLEFDFGQALADRFLGGSSAVQFAVFGAPLFPLNVNDFNNTSINGPTPLFIAAHIAGIPIGDGQTSSVWITTAVPEPSTYLCLASFLGVGAFLMRRRMARVRC